MKELSNSKKIAVFGGGRWSKTLLEILIKNTKPDIKFSVHTEHLVDEMIQWSKKNNYMDRITITHNDPVLDQQYFGAVVANSIRSHKEKALLALESRIPVLVEKPMTPSLSETKELIELAKNLNTQLFSSWVFRYARYIDNFIKYIKEFGPINEIDIIWKDPINEKRHGEIKTYDKASPAFEDVLPHLISILSKVLNRKDFEYKSCLTKRGGASMELLLLSGNTKCNLKIERNSLKRVRKIVINSNKDIFLDFSKEPGVIKIKEKEFIGDPKWYKSPRPLTRMIIDFLSVIKNKESNNKNLDNSLALIASRITDQVKISYNEELYDWFMSCISLKNKSIKEDDLVYFISEIIYKELSLPHKDKDKMISKVMKFIFKNLNNGSLNESFTKDFFSNNLIEDVNHKIFSICSK